MTFNMTEYEYTKRRESYASSFGTKEQIAEAIQALDDAYSKHKQLLIDIAEGCADIDDIN